MIAAAVGDARGLSLGIDIEWMNPDRPFAEIAGTILPSVPSHVGGAAFYRGWTFGEAYFKAFQRPPPEDVLFNFAFGGAPDGIHRLVDGVRALTHRIAEVFQLCVVWRADGDQECSVTFVPEQEPGPYAGNGMSVDHGTHSANLRVFLNRHELPRPNSDPK
jgi:hypothetical protein